MIWLRTLCHLLLEAGACIHDEAPQLVATGHRRDVQAIHVALFDMLLHPGVGNIVVVPLLHGSMSIVHGDPLCGRQPQANLLFGNLQISRRLDSDVHKSRAPLQTALEGKL